MAALYFYRFLVVSSFFVVFYALWKIISSWFANGATVDVDTGAYFLLSMSIFWVFGLIQWLGVKKAYKKIIEKWALAFVLFWLLFIFIASLISGIAHAYYLESRGYIKCSHPNALDSMSLGHSYQYRLNNDPLVGCE